jgi:CRISPR-associated protein Csd2
VEQNQYNEYSNHKKVNTEGDGLRRSSDTMGMKHRVDKGIYVFRGSMNPQLAERTGFSDEDAEVIKGILPRLFENDASSPAQKGAWPCSMSSGGNHPRISEQFQSEIALNGTSYFKNGTDRVPHESNFRPPSGNPAYRCRWRLGYAVLPLYPSVRRERSAPRGAPRS